MNEYARYHESFRHAASGGDLCRGPECSGWHLSELDTWHRCHGDACGGAGNTEHPEGDYDAGVIAPAVELPEVEPVQKVCADDDIPF